MMKLLAQQKSGYRLKNGSGQAIFGMKGIFPVWCSLTNMGNTTGRIPCSITCKSWLKKLVCGGIRFHDLRHTFAVSFILAGDDIYTMLQ